MHLDPEMCAAVLDAIVVPSDRVRPKVGPCSVLHERVQQLGWWWGPDHHYYDHEGHRIHIWEDPIQVLAYSWQWFAATQVTHRNTMSDLHHTNARFTMEGWAQNTQDKAYLRCSLNGTFYTADHMKHRRNPQATCCPLCGEQDNLYHRTWACIQLEHTRSHFTVEEKQAILNMPQSTYLHGWFELPPATVQFLESLHNIPDTTLTFLPVRHTGLLEAFTDGACKSPTDKFNRLCAWAVVISSEDDRWDFQPLSQGLLPGMLQTVVRAELTAVISALSYAIQVGRSIRIWTDNQFVCDTIRTMMQTSFVVDRQKPNHDLLAVLHVLIHQAGNSLQGVVKVVSHQQVHLGLTPTERWVIAGNDAADNVATNAYFSSPEIMDNWQRSGDALRTQRNLKRKLHEMLIAIGQHCTLHAKQNAADPEPTLGYLEPRQLEMAEWRFPDQLPFECQSYMVPEYAEMRAWMDSLQTDTGQIHRWSWFQLVLDGVRRVPSFGPWYQLSTKQWMSGQYRKERNLQEMAKSFGLWMTRLSGRLGLKLPMVYCHPSSGILAFGCKTLPVCVDSGRQLELEQFLAQKIKVARKPSDLAEVAVL